MSLRLELSRGAALRATTLKAFVRGVGVTGFPRWRNGGPGQSPRERSTLRHNEGTACDLRSMTRQAFLGLMLDESMVTCVIINTSYQKLPFGSGDYPDKLLFRQALN